MTTRIREIIQQYFDNDYSDYTRKEFTRWMKDAAGDAEKDAAFRRIWDELAVVPGPSTEKSYQSLQEKIQVASASGSRRDTPSIPLVRKLLRIAAILVLPLLSAGITYQVMKNGMAGESTRLVECIVPDGEIRTVTLPDMSVVKVNSGSILIYPEQFTDTRDIYLNGEAYFTVAHDESKPFVVKTGDMAVEALGTVFNVSAYADNRNLSASLESGKVRVTFNGMGKEPVLLLPDEQVTYNRNTGLVDKKAVKIENVIAWIDGHMVIQSMPLNDVIKIVERKYAVNVYFDPNKYRNERITLKVVQEESIADFMTVLEYLIPEIKYKIKNDNVYIY